MMRDFDREFNRVSQSIEKGRSRIRIFQAVFLIIWIALFLSIVVGVILLLTNPEIIGEFFGRILSGFKSA